jgi:hypothetical protein
MFDFVGCLVFYIFMYEKDRQVCPGCPLDASYEVGLSEIENYCDEAELHRTTDQHDAAVGSANLGKSILADLVKKIGCSGPAIIDGGYRTCPNVRTVYDVRQIIEGPANSNIKFPRLENTTSTSHTGQYL